jgi:CTP:molybdopterin cytidylyltransferase MocA
MIPRPWVVLLAAGGSRRFGAPKQLARIGGESLLRRAARVALAAAPAGCVVVLGARASRLARELEGLPIRAVVNRRWQSGLGGSLAVGIAALPADARAALVLLADQVAVGPADLQLLCAAWRAAPTAIIAARCGRIIGPPAIFPRRYFPELHRLRGDQGARDLLRDGTRRVVALELAAASADIDRPRDLPRVRRERSRARTRQPSRSSRAHRSRRSGAT